MDSSYQPQMKIYKGDHPIPFSPHRAPHPAAPFQFQHQDARTGTALGWAAFVLHHEDRIIDFAQSDVCGTVFFETPPPGCYVLTETCPPPGYETDGCSHHVVVDYDRHISIDGIPIERFSVGNLLTRIPSGPGLPNC